MPRFTITLPGRPPQPYRIGLDRKTICIGRGPVNDIIIDSTSVSQIHAELRHLPGSYEIGDLGSTNGITQDGGFYKLIHLQNGAVFSIGDAQCQFSLTEEEIQALADEANAHALPVAPLPTPPSRTQSRATPASPKRPRGPRPATVRAMQSSGGGFLATMVFLIIAVAAFFTGLAIRHQRETGGSLYDAIRLKAYLHSTPATPAPAN
jgi:pSer/pThr/pTyr-binding forkhead associated (FHA) protein